MSNKYNIYFRHTVLLISIFLKTTHWVQQLCFVHAGPPALLAQVWCHRTHYRGWEGSLYTSPMSLIRTPACRTAHANAVPRISRPYDNTLYRQSLRVWPPSHDDIVCSHCSPRHSLQGLQDQYLHQACGMHAAILTSLWLCKARSWPRFLCTGMCNL